MQNRFYPCISNGTYTSKEFDSFCKISLFRKLLSTFENGACFLPTANIKQSLWLRYRWTSIQYVFKYTHGQNSI